MELELIRDKLEVCEFLDVFLSEYSEAFHLNDVTIEHQTSPWKHQS